MSSNEPSVRGVVPRMRARAVVLLAVPAVFLAACFDDGGGGALYGLTEGDYLTSNGAVAQDECEIGITPADVNGNYLAVSTAAGVVLVDGDEHQRSGNAFSRSESNPGQQVDANCTLDVAFSSQGVIVTSDVFVLTLRLTASNPVGSSCGQLGISFPCTTQVSFRADLD